MKYTNNSTGAVHIKGVGWVQPGESFDFDGKITTNNVDKAKDTAAPAAKIKKEKSE
ncbi:MAG: hypothetical protein H8E44_28465 [Planctomycetes bacterium]|nr:hypothetical protein [Planctomycetota bacterium]